MPGWGTNTVPRKSFRIEQMLTDGEPSVDIASSEIKHELMAPHAQVYRPSAAASEMDAEADAMRDMLARCRTELFGVANAGPETLRAADELRAAIAGTDRATQNVLKAAESIDDTAKTLAASVQTDCEMRLVQDLQDQITAIYEACNFQDIVGQRVTKAIGTLNLIDAQIARLLAILATGDARPLGSSEARTASTLVNGPMLEGDRGHASQQDVDAMFPRARHFTAA